MAAATEHHVHAIAVVRQDPTSGVDCSILSLAEDLSTFSYFTRGTARQGVVFGIRTVGTRIPAGISRVTHQGFLCQCFMLASGLGVCVLTTEDYPARVAVSLAQQLTEQFDSEIGAATWRTAVDFSHSSWAPICSAIVKFQNPVEADTLLRVRSKLDKTKESLVQTIDDVLKRGEALEKLTEESKDLSETSRKFYKTAAKTDSCCAVM